MFRRNQPSKLRTLLILGRVSNLPTIWSNCLAGWWLGGGGSWLQLLWLCIATTFLYIGGMFLNDAFDAEFDRQRRLARPIPLGTIETKEVLEWGFGWLALGMLCLIAMGTTAGILSVLLVVCIVVYDVIHKAFALAPILMALCRVMVYLIAASVALKGITGAAVWSAIALGTYVAGLSYLARYEHSRISFRYWPIVLMAGPVVLALLVDDADYRYPALGLSFILIYWVLWALRRALWRPDRNIGYTVSRLLAGIALVDLLAVAEIWHPVSLLFVFFFLLSLLFQRYIPAT